MRIKDLIVCGSNGVKSAFTKADPSSIAVKDPVPETFAALNTGYKSAESASGGGKVLGGA